MIRILSGNTHEVITGVTLLSAQGRGVSVILQE
jgi:predicted house-cleaning NTP pyrophosphatase (Maf/HAM1 superfamily)